MSIQNNLRSISELYKTDKLEHGYIEIYDSYFKDLRNKELKVLEIGVADGKSLLTWSDYFKNSTIIGIDIHKIDIKEKKLDRKNIKVHQGSQSDEKFIKEIISIYGEFDIIIDDGSHLSKDVKKSFHLLFPHLVKNGLYAVEDMQTSYNHFFGGNPFDLKYSNSHMNFFKHLTDRLNYQEIANPFYITNKYDSLITNISFYHNLVFVRKGTNDILSKEVLNHSYEDMKFKEKSSRTGKSLKYYFKYKIFYKVYTYLFMIFNLIKRILLLRF
ncbi:MAG: class I SAM-dependent methyltransferase [Candidatus Pelagibacter sp.]|jgi:23S rRNA U2552 (ribose-2'-O)-methylase RlmE/FtsJ|nr:class I SAM-dependent methyltransferase [Candidatus Pelagibacter sp.]MBT3693340.1 class I SAM-dependent methyltransferase [Candidatus Pelagibacter sp.]|tara:strand:+ start:4518 stop:5330 length:813 start_codon:yes stop_codon:yes gene_type:complete